MRFRPVFIRCEKPDGCCVLRRAQRLNRGDIVSVHCDNQVERGEILRGEGAGAQI